MLYTVRHTRMCSAKLFGSLEAEQMAGRFTESLLTGAMEALDIKYPEVLVQLTVPQSETDIQDDEWRTEIAIVLCLYMPEDVEDEDLLDEGSKYFELLLSEAKLRWNKVGMQ